ncbi:MAG: FAD-linked oxidase C-terminal domain-containing protein [Actinomycetota bacterium]
MPGGSELVDDLRAVVGADRLRSGPFDTALYSRDGSLIRGDAGVVVLPVDADEVQQIVRVCHRHGTPFVARGSGTGLAGGAVPVGDPVVIVLSKMDRLLEVDVEERVAWVEPGILNLDVSTRLRPHGLHFAPDPSSQSVCSIGGNVANNSGGPHCLAYGVTSAHILAMEVVLPDGRVTTLGSLDPEPAGYDLRGVFVGSEGTLGIATKVAVRLTPNPPDVRTLLLDFTSVADGAAAVSGIIAGGVVPAALEMMDRPAVEVVEAFVHAGYPTDAAAVLLVEVDGPAAACDAEVEAIVSVAREHGVRDVRVAADDAERDLLWKGRKAAFGAVASVAPDYYLHDTVVPRTRLVEVLDEIYDIAARHELQVINVFHAGDGNLHPILAFDAREDGVIERVHRAGEEIVRASLDAGGVLSGEHGIGIEKRDFMPMMFSAHDLELQDRLRAAFDPGNLANPEKVIPSGSRCGDLSPQRVPAGAWV